MDSFLTPFIDWIVSAIGMLVLWILKDLKNKATEKELDEVKGELKELRNKVYETLQDLATKDDIKILNAKLDRLTERFFERPNK